MAIEEKMIPEVIEKLKQEIVLADNQEVLAKGVVNPDTGLIETVEILARGHRSAAPAIINLVEPRVVFIHNHPSGCLTPSDADLRVASMIGNQGGGFLIINNAVTEGYMVVEPYLPEARLNLDSTEITAFFKDNGLLHQALSKYEYRPQQLEMVKTIIFAFNNRRHLMVEAGTGTGKSLAYLVPAIYWAVGNNQKIVISTNTINLQEQLFYKDIPLLERTLTPFLPREFKSVLVKGRRNYVCLRKLNYLNQGHEEFSPDDLERLKQINHFVINEDLGSKSDFPFNPQEEIWEKVSSEAETCLRSKCYQFRKCFFQQARREALGADLLIVNHHLLFADLLVRKESVNSEIAVLPKYKHLVVDEAHNLEHVATEYLGYQVNYANFLRSLQYIYATKNKKQQGILQGIRNALTNGELEKAEKFSVLRLIDIEIIPVFQQVSDLSHPFFKQAVDFFQHHQVAGETKLRLVEKLTKSEEWLRKVIPLADDLTGAINLLSRKLALLYDELESLPSKKVPDYDSLLVELEGRITQLQRFFRSLEFVTKIEDENYVYWIEVFSRRKEEFYCSLQAAPLEIANQIREQVVEALDTAIFTSATLTVQGTFDFFRQNLGLTDQRVDDLLVGSPFDYQKQALVTIVKNTSTPNLVDFQKEVETYLLTILEIMQGRTLVLFTSYRMLNGLHAILKDPLHDKGIKIYKQGESSRQQIIHDFKRDKHGVIFGTSSFWEGVDIPGEELSCVVITKLPFLVPSEPVNAARIEKMEQEGKNSFLQFMLPNAVIKFKQGFGRLIRSKTDRGVVVVFDPRIFTKSYGKVFLNSLPKTQIYVNDISEISKEVKKFII